MKNQKKKCMFLIPRMINGGAERVIATIANELSKANYKVIIISLTSNESFYKLEDDVKLIGAGYKISKKNKTLRNLDMFINGFKSLFFIRKSIEEHEPDILISFLTHTNMLSLIIKFIDPKIKLIVSERCDPWSRNLLLRLATKYFYPFADAIVCQSIAVSKYFPKHSKNKISIIENPINLDSISNKNHFLRRKSIVGVGRLFKQKNFRLLIDSFYDIKDEFPDHILEIYGEGHLRDVLQNQIKILGVEDRVFLRGVMNDVMMHISDAELFVMSSDFEGFPNALIEAMASGLPVISTDFSTGVARELVKKENGILVPVNDPLSMSNAMRQILSNKDTQKIMSDENRKIKEKLSVDIVLKKWIKLFENIK